MEYNFITVAVPANSNLQEKMHEFLSNNCGDCYVGVLCEDINNEQELQNVLQAYAEAVQRIIIQEVKTRQCPWNITELN